MSLVQGHLGLGPQEIVFLVVVEFLHLVGVQGLGVETEVRDGTVEIVPGVPPACLLPNVSCVPVKTEGPSVEPGNGPITHRLHRL